MPVYQINVWVCEVCGKVESTIQETSPHNDLVVAPPDNIDWGYIGEGPDEKLACPECCVKHKAADNNIDKLEAQKAGWIKKRQAVIAILREVCAEFGDNEWEENLHLADVIKKHLAKHLWADQQGDAPQVAPK